MVYTLNERNEIITGYGSMIPQFTEGDLRKKYNGSLSCSKQGDLRSISLEDSIKITTPIGTVPAEKVMFYDTGELKRVFPTNGKISGYWSEEDESALCPILDFEIPQGRVKSKVINISFYRSGNVRSITLWPREIVKIGTPFGCVPIRNGLSLYENGRLRSFEPAVPTDIGTPVGRISAFDPTAIGINADTGSITLDDDGSISSIMTVHNTVIISDDRVHDIISPSLEHSMTSDDEWVVNPLRMSFTPVSVTFNESRTYDLKSYSFSIEKYRNPLQVHGRPIIPDL